MSVMHCFCCDNTKDSDFVEFSECNICHEEVCIDCQTECEHCEKICCDDCLEKHEESCPDNPINRDDSQDHDPDKSKKEAEYAHDDSLVE